MKKRKVVLRPLDIIKTAQHNIFTQREEHKKMKENFNREWQKWGVSPKKDS